MNIDRSHNRSTNILLPLCLSILICSSQLFGQTSLDGYWEGAIKIMNQEIKILVHFQSETKALIDVPQQGAKDLELKNVARNGDSIHFELPSGLGQARFDGVIKEKSITGDFSQGGATGTFFLNRSTPPKPDIAVEAPIPLRPIIGTWNGAVQLGEMDLIMIVEFSYTSNGLKAAIDLPQQGAKSLPLSKVSFENPKVHFELVAGPGLAIFEGELKGDSLLGQFSQSGIIGPFKLGKGALKEAAKEPPPPYKQEEVVFHNDSTTLAGTLTLPVNQGKHPAVVMITGSGAQNRDEELLGFKPFKIIADYFTRHGIAVLRYDDRGIGGSSGNTMASTTSDFANDALAAVAYLQSRSDINPKQIGMCGHSEGGIVAPLAASRSSDVSFIILMSGTGVDGGTIILAQTELIMKAEKAGESEIKESLDLSRRMFQAFREEKPLTSFSEELSILTRKGLDKMKPEQRKAITKPEEYVAQQVKTQLLSFASPWMKYFLRYDPAPALEKVHCPVLMLFGELDLQVPTELNKPKMEAALARGGNTKVTTKVFPKANHLYLAATTGSPSEYATMKKEFVPGFLETMSTWIHQQVSSRQ
ncbi:MAG: alpha/beta fold hydrolase [bacterium]